MGGDSYGLFDLERLESVLEHIKDDEPLKQETYNVIVLNMNFIKKYFSFANEYVDAGVLSSTSISQWRSVNGSLLVVIEK